MTKTRPIEWQYVGPGKTARSKPVRIDAVGETMGSGAWVVHRMSATVGMPWCVSHVATGFRVVSAGSHARALRVLALLSASDRLDAEARRRANGHTQSRPASAYAPADVEAWDFLCWVRVGAEEPRDMAERRRVAEKRAEERAHREVIRVSWQRCCEAAE